VSTAAPARAEVWTRHWASGSPHSCAGSYGDTYGGAFAAFWRGVLARTPAGARVLDLATGAGALPRLFLQLAPELGLDIDAVDLADVAPAWIHALPSDQAGRLRFHGRTALEQLPFGDASFDRVVSQYGLEYARRPEALDELRRVLRPGGGCALVFHHAEARPVRLARIELEHIDWLTSTDGLLAAARSMIDPMVRAATPAGRAGLATDHRALAARQTFNDAQERLEQRARAAPDGADVLLEARDAVAGALGLARTQGLHAGAESALAGLATDLADARLRLRELRDCALDAPAAATLAEALAAASSTPTLDTLRDGSHLMGWTLRIDT
jgi:SAM-dependent methyltransferase